MTRANASRKLRIAVGSSSGGQVRQAGGNLIAAEAPPVRRLGELARRETDEIRAAQQSRKPQLAPLLGRASARDRCQL